MTTIAYNMKTGKVAFRFDNNATNDDFDAGCKGVPNAFVEKLDNLSIAELAKVYNATTSGDKVNKFSSKQTGVERVMRALDEAGVPLFESSGKPAKKQSKKPAKEKAVKAPKEPKAPKAPKQKAEPGSQGAAVAKSWTDANVFKARTTRHTVNVGKQTFRSVGQAFTELGLPMGRMIAFRMALKAEGKKVFEHEGTKYNFVAHQQEK